MVREEKDMNNLEDRNDRANASDRDNNGNWDRNDIDKLSEIDEKIETSEQEGLPKKPPLDKRVLFFVLVGIAAVFPMMMVVNGFIFTHTPDQKTAYYFSISASNLLFILVVLIVKAQYKLTWVELGWKKTGFKSGLVDVLKIWGITWLIHIVYMMILFMQGINAPENELLKLLVKPSLLTFVINILLIAVAAPLIEETLFRGLLFGSMRTYFGTWTAIILSAAIFSALHMELIGFLPRFVLGIGLGYLYVKHQSLYPSIGLHALNNLLAVLMISVYS